MAARRPLRASRLALRLRCQAVLTPGCLPVASAPHPTRASPAATSPPTRGYRVASSTRSASAPRTLQRACASGSVSPHPLGSSGASARLCNVAWPAGAGAAAGSLAQRPVARAVVAVLDRPGLAGQPEPEQRRGLPPAGQRQPIRHQLAALPAPGPRLPAVVGAAHPRPGQVRVPHDQVIGRAGVALDRRQRVGTVLRQQRLAAAVAGVTGTPRKSTFSPSARSAAGSPPAARQLRLARGVGDQRDRLPGLAPRHPPVRPAETLAIPAQASVREQHTAVQRCAMRSSLAGATRAKTRWKVVSEGAT